MLDIAVTLANPSINMVKTIVDALDQIADKHISTLGIIQKLAHFLVSILISESLHPRVNRKYSIGVKK